MILKLKHPSFFETKVLFCAGEQGFEPQTSRPERDVMPFHHSPIYLLADPESAVLPLDEPPSIPAGGIVA